MSITEYGTVAISPDGGVMVSNFTIDTNPDGSPPSPREAVEWARDRLIALLAAQPDKTCPTCGQWIEREAGDPRPNSPGDHDPAPHVAKAYGS